MTTADDQYEAQNDVPIGDITADDTEKNEYMSRTGQSEIPVQKDELEVEDPIDPDTADTDAQLARDDSDAIDKSNIIGGRTRGAKPSTGYAEPGDDEGLPGADDGTSRLRTGAV
ncbi:MAG: hypothetical protein M1837_005943 [Sclerophora amabilis]|nr:MAG: hypothetical protein M1837_005943 [Sclerophora amabilis]